MRERCSLPITFSLTVFRFSRNGKELLLPLAIVDSLPRIFTDGELWYSITLFPSHQNTANTDNNIELDKRLLMIAAGGSGGGRGERV